SYRVSNHSSGTLEVALELNSAMENLRVRRSAKIPAGESVVMNLVYPKFDMVRYHISDRPSILVEIEGKIYESEVLSNAIQYIYQYDKGPFALCSTSIPSEEFEAIYGNCWSHNSLYSFVRSPMGLNEWSSDVEDYMNYNVIWVTAEDVVPPDVEAALRKWVFQGGKLIRCVMGQWPSNLAANFPEGNPNRFCHEERIGLGSIMTFKPYLGKNDGVAEFARKVRDNPWNFWNKPDAKLPACVYDPGNLSDIVMPHRDVISSIAEDTKSSHSFSIEAPDAPIGMLVLIMSIFVILVGPVNFVMLNKRKHTALMVLTIPVISLLFCILVFSYVAVSSGFSLHGKIYGFTYLDQNEKLAATCAHVSLLAPNMTRRNLVFDANDNVCLYHQTTINVLDRPGMEIDSSAIPVRTPLNYTVKRCDTTNEKIRVNPTDDGMEIVNGLSAPLSHFMYRDIRGHLYYAENVPEGKRVPLTRLDKGDALPPLTPSAKEISEMQAEMRRKNSGRADDAELVMMMALGKKYMGEKRLEDALDVFESVLMKSPTEEAAIHYLAVIGNIQKRPFKDMERNFIENRRNIVFNTIFHVDDKKSFNKVFINNLSGTLPPSMFAALTDRPMFYKPGITPDKGETRHFILGKTETPKVEW
ncbi:MAG: hypothetical protein J5833_05490, partial [Victivallales bacterium]|nr:hypothetical protein [Victivallales bacterium]